MRGPVSDMSAPARIDIQPGAWGGPDQASRLRALVQAHHAAADLPAPRRTGRASVIAIASGKGGVGKTSLAVNLSIALAARRLRVTLVDADLGMANADVMCGLSPARRLEHALPTPHADRPCPLADIALDAPGGFRLVPGSVGVARMADLNSHERDALLHALAELESDSDVLIIDTGAGIGPVVLSMLRWADLGLVVVTPDPASITDAYALIKCARLAQGPSPAQPPPLALLINQAASAAEAAAVRDRLTNCTARFLGFRPTLLGWVPRHDEVARSVRQRRPFALGDPRAEPAQGLHRLADATLRAVGRSPGPPIPPSPPGLRSWFRSAFGV